MGKWFDVESVPESHTFSEEVRPGKDPIPLWRTYPIIDLGGSNQSDTERRNTVDKLLKASQEYGLFQVVNHGVGEDIIEETMKVVEELFRRPAEEISEDAKENGWVYTGSSDLPLDGRLLWRDNLKHQCNPLEESMQHWPQNPKRYREVVGKYIKEMRRLSLRILEVISEGLRTEDDLGKMSQVQFMSAGHYPRCPDPSQALGLLRHFDHGLITILLQNAEGLQVFEDGNWVGVGVVPNAFVVNIGTQIQIISNGKLRSPEHRVVPNGKEGRTAIATFINPTRDSIIEPAKSCVDEANPPLYPSRSFDQIVHLSKPFGPSTDVLHG